MRTFSYDLIHNYFFIVIVILFLICPYEVIASWLYHFDDLQLSSQDCYKTIQECIEKRQVPDARYSRMALMKPAP